MFEAASNDMRYSIGAPIGLPISECVVGAAPPGWCLADSDQSHGSQQSCMSYVPNDEQKHHAIRVPENLVFVVWKYIVSKNVLVLLSFNLLLKLIHRPSSRFPIYSLRSQ